MRKLHLKNVLKPIHIFQRSLRKMKKNVIHLFYCSFMKCFNLIRNVSLKLRYFGAHHSSSSECISYHQFYSIFVSHFAKVITIDGSHDTYLMKRIRALMRESIQNRHFYYYLKVKRNYSYERKFWFCSVAYE